MPTPTARRLTPVRSIALGLMLVAAAHLFGGCQSHSTDAGTGLTQLLGASRAGSELDFFDQLDAAQLATWADLLACASMARGVPMDQLRDDAGVMAYASSLGLLGDSASAPNLADPVTVMDVASVASRALGEPVRTDADARRAITRLDDMGVLTPNTQPGWNVSGPQLLGVVAALNDQISAMALPSAAAIAPMAVSEPMVIATTQPTSAPSPSPEPFPTPPPASSAPSTNPWASGSPIAPR